MEIHFEILNDYRNFKKGDNYTIEIIPNEILYLAAPNKYGKTTLLNALRGRKDSLKELNLHDTDGMSCQTRDLTYVECKKYVNVEGFDYDEAFFMESVSDDPCSFENAATAWGLVTTGGLSVQRYSKGEKAVFLLCKLADQIKKCLIKKYGSVDEWKSSGKKGLVVIDEIDDGLDPHFQLNYNGIIRKIFIDAFSVDVVVVSHSLLCPLGKFKTDDYHAMVYSFKCNRKFIPETWFNLETKYTLVKDDEECLYFYEQISPELKEKLDKLINFKTTLDMTYQDVCVWLKEKGVIVSLIPNFTSALWNKTMYYWRIYYVNGGELKTISEESVWTPKTVLGGSFKTTMDNVISFLIPKYNGENFKF